MFGRDAWAAISMGRDPLENARPAQLITRANRRRRVMAPSYLFAPDDPLSITQLFIALDRHQHGFCPDDVDLVADLHLGESLLVLNRGGVLPVVRPGEGDRRRARVDGRNRDRER